MQLPASSPDTSAGTTETPDPQVVKIVNFLQNNHNLPFSAREVENATEVNTALEDVLGAVRAQLSKNGHRLETSDSRDGTKYQAVKN